MLIAIVIWKLSNLNICCDKQRWNNVLQIGRKLGLARDGKTSDTVVNYTRCNIIISKLTFEGHNQLHDFVKVGLENLCTDSLSDL